MKPTFRPLNARNESRPILELLRVAGDKICICGSPCQSLVLARPEACRHDLFQARRKSVNLRRIAKTERRLPKDRLAMLLRLLHRIFEFLLHFERRLEQPFLRPAFNFCCATLWHGC